MKMKMKKIGKMSLIFEFSISELGYTEIFMKIWVKIFWIIFKSFLTNRGKNEDADKRIWENEFNFWIIHIEIRLYDNFHENLFKKKIDPFFRTFLTNRGKNEDEDKKIWENEFNLWILHIEIRLYGNFHENLRRKWNEKVL